MKYKVVPDVDAQSPLLDDNLGTLVCFHDRYNLGNTDHGFRKDDYLSFDELQRAIEKQNPRGIILPLFLYDHSGITISTKSFSCAWDSGQIGFVFISGDKIKDEYGVKKRISKQLRERVTGYLRNEVNTYDMYLRGECYGYVIEDEDGEAIESCWGYYGEKDAEEDAKEALNEIINSRKESKETIRA